MSDRLLSDTVRTHTGRVLAALIASLHDFDLAEEAFQEAAVVALEVWPRDGLPDAPAAWLTTVARRKALDRLRHQRMREGKLADVAVEERLRREEEEDSRNRSSGTAVPDERLRLIFTCCHPALAEDARVALTLRTLGGLTAAEIARAFLVNEATMQKRLVRAKQKIRAARIPYRVPEASELPERVASVLAVVYLIFNQSWTLAERGDAGLERDVLRLTAVLCELMPRDPEVLGLRALVLLHGARRAARVVGGRWVPLDEQDPELWEAEMMSEGMRVLRSALALASARAGAYQLQACISALHVASRVGEPRWQEIADLYAQLDALLPSPVVALNRAVALARIEGPDAGLRLVEALAESASGSLAGYQPFHAARADLLRRAGRLAEAAISYRRAIALTEGDPERRYLEARLAEVRTAH